MLLSGTSSLVTLQFNKTRINFYLTLPENLFSPSLQPQSSLFYGGTVTDAKINLSVHDAILIGKNKILDCSSAEIFRFYLFHQRLHPIMIVSLTIMTIVLVAFLCVVGEKIYKNVKLYRKVSKFRDFLPNPSWTIGHVWLVLEASFRGYLGLNCTCNLAPKYKLNYWMVKKFLPFFHCKTKES